ncbi:nucleoside hydrolase [Ligilactobacillus aviarius]|uniref:Nucleoside hydrolase n=1 Tax=Ligilactobacillus aviarius TaxID=1606 RepID=A0A179C3U6_9LACO|nr:nucleoside hydrolase [Ligilactobacillus aviarius]OAP98463.1 nucleoside hydrolase [Ligilactobacillus aviarius]OAP99560.1 nucleoside hydrolase [Ligilactobacillus aviarius]OAQ01759.1 nucleoside hydrolase [Ligilactobacillus aviarius]OAQ02544.1 nucleoside hydrolase [Ligilactobacillus aviarius]OAQ06320.1 nucleoside hydrolase [Ligilactobacillus aviarius]
MNKRKKVVIDCDPGIDDFLALWLALRSPELDVMGITIVAGNVPVEQGVKNALKVLKITNRLDIPVYAGAQKPLKKPYISAQDTHGEDGLGESDFEDVTNGICRQNASEFLNKTLMANSDVTVIAIGPLTNIAIAMQKDIQAWKKCKALISMGGAFKSYGNCSPVAEYNYWCDPDAASYVYKHSPVLITMVGLDVTRKIVLTPNILELIQQENSEVASVIRKITRFYFDFHWKQEKVIGCVINDPLTVALLLDPEICSGFKSYVQINTDSGIGNGQSIVDEKSFYHHDANAKVLTQVDSIKFMKLFLNRIAEIDLGLLDQILPAIMGEKD